MRLDERQGNRADPDPDALGASPSVPALLRKYRELAARYQDLVVKYDQRAHERIDGARLADWAMRTSDSGLCAVRDGNVILTNARFEELDRRAPRRWRLAGEKAATGTPGATLRALVAAAAMRVADGAPQAPAHLRLVNRGSTLDARLELFSKAHEQTPVVMCLVHDVTAEVKREREAERARAAMQRRERLRALGVMVAGIAHDLNNTFNALNLRLEVMQRHGEGRDDDFDAIRRIVSDAATRIARLQDFASNRHEVAEEEIDLAAVIRAAAEIARPPELEGSPRTEIVLRVDDDLPPVRGIAAEPRHVFVNLLLNARDAMPDGGKIEIGARRGRAGIVCTMKDRGPGIPEDVRKKIFEPFFTTKGKRGTGMGLAMVKDCLQRMGGRIEAKNRKDGGSCFTLTIPVSTGERPAAQTRARPLPEATSRGRVLVVDDELENLQVMRELLELEGHEVVLASSGSEALDKVAGQGPFDLVLCDIGMPGQSGWEVARALTRSVPETAVVMLTGWGEAEKSLRPGEVGVVHKPVAMDTLRAILAKVLARPNADG